jgi:hypothetical protein
MVEDELGRICKEAVVKCWKYHSSIFLEGWLNVLRESVKLKSAIFWDITPRSPLSVNLRFGGKYPFHLQGRKNK